MVKGFKGFKENKGLFNKRIIGRKKRKGETLWHLIKNSLK